MRQQVDCNASPDIGQSGQLVTPDMLVQHDAMDEQRQRTGTRLAIADAPRGGVDAARGQCGLLVAHDLLLPDRGVALRAEKTGRRAPGLP